MGGQERWGWEVPRREMAPRAFQRLVGICVALATCIVLVNTLLIFRHATRAGDLEKSRERQSVCHGLARAIDPKTEETEESAYMVWTAAGEDHLIHEWVDSLCGRPSYSLHVTYGGEKDSTASRLESLATRFSRQPGGKFDSLHRALESDPGLLDGVTHVMIPDANLTLSVTKINLLFALHEELDLVLSGPSYEWSAWWRSQEHPKAFDGGEMASLARFGAFVDKDCPVFEVSALRKFMAAYRHWSAPSQAHLQDYHYYSVLQPSQLEYAVIDLVEVTRPTLHRGGRREVERASAYLDRNEKWRATRGWFDRVWWGHVKPSLSKWRRKEYFRRKIALEDLKCAPSLGAMVAQAGVSPQRCLGSRFYASEREKYYFPDEAVRRCESYDFRDIPKFVITLDRNGPSVGKFHERAARVGFGDVCRVQAVPGRECLANTETYPRMPSDPLAPAIGISHMKIMRHLVDNNIAVAIIMEEDALGDVAPDFCVQVQAAIDSQADYDILRMEYHTYRHLDPGGAYAHPGEVRHVTSGPHAMVTSWSVDIDPRPQANTHRRLSDPGLHYCENQWGTATFAVTLEGARRSLRGYLPHLFPIDNYDKYPNIDDLRLQCFYPVITRYDRHSGDFSHYSGGSMSEGAEASADQSAGGGIQDCPASDLQVRCPDWRELVNGI